MDFITFGIGPGGNIQGFLLSGLSPAQLDCPPFEFHSHGRQGIGVVQPQSGTDYPLIQPSDDVRYLIADLQLTFDDPGRYDGEPFRPPFRVHWLYGVGCEGDELSCSSTSSMSLSSASVGDVDAEFCPLHAAEITIVDADDRVVFHSPLADEYMERDWGDRLHIYEWRDNRLGCCLLTVHTKWTLDLNPVPRYYPTNFFPDDATLDERSWMVLPKRVRSLTVVLDNLARTAVDFAAGYNMELVPEGPVTTEFRRVNKIKFNATPGAGLGIFPGCEPQPLYIRRINGVGPTTAGDFYLAATDCYWVRQPTSVVSTDPRLTVPRISRAPGSIPEENLPDPDAGTSKELPGWPPDDDPAYAHLQIGNDCKPCCDCPDYVDAGNYLNRIRDQYDRLGIEFENTRDLYHANRERWLAARACIHRRPLRLFLQAQHCPFLDVAIQFVNQTGECLTELELTVDFTTSPQGAEGTEVPGYTFISGASKRTGRRSNKTEKYKMEGVWPQFSAYFDYVDVGQSVNARFRLRFEDCGELPGNSSLSSMSGDSEGGKIPVSVTGVLTGTNKGESVKVIGRGGEILSSSSFSSGMLVDASDTDTETLNCPPDDGESFQQPACCDE